MNDFKIVADCFVQIRKNKNYVPIKETIRHVDEVLKLMSVLTNDDRFYQIQNSEKLGGEITMCEVLDKVEERGKEIGKEIGKEQGLFEAYCGLVGDGLLSIDVAAKRCNMTVEEFQRKCQTESQLM